MAQRRTQHSKTYVPVEAHGIAGQFRGAAGEIRDLAASLRAIGSLLDNTWAGHSKDHFSQACGPEPGNTEALAAWLEATATDIQNLTVTESWSSWEWVADPELGPHT